MSERKIPETLIVRCSFYHLFLIHSRQDTSRNGKSVRGCLLKSAGYGCAVADRAETMDICLEIFVNNDFVGVEFNFHTVEKCLVARDTRSNLIECL